MKTAVIIPARFGSTRLPAKMLAKIGEKTVIEHTLARAQESKADAVIVATDHEQIAELVQKAGGQAVLTDTDLPSGTDRCAQALRKLQAAGQDFDYVVNVQGDEVFIPAEQINMLIEQLQSGFEIVTMVQPIHDSQQLSNPNVVKAVLGQPRGQKISPALYFSRAEIPYTRAALSPEEKMQQQVYYKHVGIYGFRSPTLLELVQLPVSYLERVEMLEQLRWVENGYPIGAVQTSFSHLSIDTDADLQQARRVWSEKF